MEKRCEMDSLRGVETLAGEKQKEMIKYTIRIYKVMSELCIQGGR